MKKLLAPLLAAVLLSGFASPAFAQGVVIMPDSTNNRLVAFDPMNGALLTSNMFSLVAGSTPIHAIQVGNEIWISEQIGDRVSRWALDGTFLGQIGGGPTGGLDNVRGMAVIGDTVYVTNGGTANGSPGANSVVMYSTAGAFVGSFQTTALAPSPFGILAHQGGILVSSSSGGDDIHRFTLLGTSLGTFHNSTSLNFVEQLAFATNGSILTVGFSTNNIAYLDPNTGALVSSFAAPGARGVYQLGNGNVLWTSGAGTFIYDVLSGTSSQVYAGGGRYLEFAPVPEPSSLLACITGGGILLLALRRRNRNRP